MKPLSVITIHGIFHFVLGDVSGVAQFHIRTYIYILKPFTLPSPPPSTYPTLYSYSAMSPPTPLTCQSCHSQFTNLGTFEAH